MALFNYSKVFWYYNNMSTTRIRKKRKETMYYALILCINKNNFSREFGRLFLDFFSLKNLECLPQCNMRHGIESNTEPKTMKMSVSVSLVFQNKRCSVEYCILIDVLIKVSIAAEHSEGRDFILFRKIPAA